MEPNLQICPSSSSIIGIRLLVPITLECGGFIRSPRGPPLLSSPGSVCRRLFLSTPWPHSTAHRKPHHSRFVTWTRMRRESEVQVQAGSPLHVASTTPRASDHVLALPCLQIGGQALWRPLFTRGQRAGDGRRAFLFFRLYCVLASEEWHAPADRADLPLYPWQLKISSGHSHLPFRGAGRDYSRRSSHKPILLGVGWIISLAVH
jgi:hypothetical protein